MKPKPIKIIGKVPSSWQLAKKMGISRKEYLRIKKIIDKAFKEEGLK